MLIREPELRITDVREVESRLPKMGNVVGGFVR
jgi:hypothetical protein